MFNNLEGCTAPQRERERAACGLVVELIALDNAEIKEPDRTELVPRRRGRQGRHLQLRHQSVCDCRGVSSTISWRQVETGSAIHAEISFASSCAATIHEVNSIRIAVLESGHQQIDSGTKTLASRQEHGRADIISKGISAGKSNNTYRGQVSADRKAENARNFTERELAADRQ